MSFDLGFAVAFISAGLVSFCVASVCEKPLSNLMRRIIRNETSSAFTRYVRFVTYLVGISHGVNVNPLSSELAAHILERISIDRVSNYPEWWMWMSSIQTVILQPLIAIAYMYLALFVLGLIAYIIVRVREQQLLE
ncbi:MAG: hypothetical protein OXN17_10950 [Candidatus Poribacteria bacterium]|nr:hypothetical protein [Candidatus Poribacteria bacterium]MDE0506588.1 hypothetical protein [Candidatus Poribacteria bacterium]